MGSQPILRINGWLFILTSSELPQILLRGEAILDFGFTLRPHPYALDPSCKIDPHFCAARLTFLVSQCFVFLIVSMFLCVLCVDSKSPCG